MHDRSAHHRPTADDIHADCMRIAHVAAPEDTVRSLTERLATSETPLSFAQTKRRILAMERDLGLAPATPAEKAVARFHGGVRRAGAIAQRWRRHCL